MQGIIWVIYVVQMLARYGQTVGKMVTKVRVVDYLTEDQISPRQAWLREVSLVIFGLIFLAYQSLVIMTSDIEPGLITSGKAFAHDITFWLLASLAGLWFLAEVVTMMTNDKRRALHDFIAGTVVIRTNPELEIPQQSTPEDVSANSPPPLG